jgi:DNA-directed RNA polymerase subunit K/omega
VRRQSLLRTSDDIDSKFRYVILASKRAKQLLKGAKPKLKSKSKNLIRIAQEEVDRGMVDYEIVQSRPEDLQDIEDNIFIGEDLGFEQEIPAKKGASERVNLIEEIQGQINKMEKEREEKAAAEAAEEEATEEEATEEEEEELEEEDDDDDDDNGEEGEEEEEDKEDQD